MPTLVELREQFATAMTHAEACRKEYDGKPTTGAEIEKLNTAYEAWLNEADTIKDQIQALEKHDRLEKWASEVEETHRPRFESGKSREEIEKATRHADAFGVYLKGQTDQDWRQSKEVKAYQADNPQGGGFGVLPQVLVPDWLTLMKDFVFVRGLARIFTVPEAESLGHPTIDTDPSDADWTTELAIGNEETTLAMGKRELKPQPLAKYIKISKKLMRQVPNASAQFLDRMAYKMGVTEEKAFLTGSGANQPLGVFTASSQGISTARDVTAANASSVVGDDFWNVFFGLKAPYRRDAEWILNRTVIQAVRKLKDTTNNYIWANGGQILSGLGPGAGMQFVPDSLCGRPVNESEYAPGTITTGLYTGILGNFRFYEIADALNMEVQVLYELFAANNQMGYIMRKETDGMPVLEEAFSRLKQA